MPEPCQLLGWAPETTDTTLHGLTFNPLDLRATCGTMIRKAHRLRRFRAAFAHDADDLRDDVACSSDDHGIADTHIQTFDFICVV